MVMYNMPPRNLSLLSILSDISFLHHDNTTVRRNSELNVNFAVGVLCSSLLDNSYHWTSFLLHENQERTTGKQTMHLTYSLSLNRQSIKLQSMDSR